MATPLKFASKRHVGLNIAARSECLKQDFHGPMGPQKKTRHKGGVVRAVDLATGTGGNSELVFLHFRADLLTQKIDRNLLPLALEVPVGPTIAAGCTFKERANLMD